MAEKKAYEKSMQPKRAPVPRKEEWEVESVLSMKEVNGNKFYKVKFVGYNKPTWEPEENVEDCTDHIEAYLDEKRKKDEYDELRRKEEADGHYEVAKVVDIKIYKNGSREFLIRWKHHTSADDSWEPEDNLDCTDLIEAFVATLSKLV